MKSLNAYLNFPGNCEEALNFYRERLGGEIVSMMRYADAPMPSTEETAQRVMHSEFRADGIQFMAADQMSEEPMAPGSNICLMVNLSDGTEQETMFNALADGGNVDMPLQDTFWGARFGTVTDRFGISWMLHHDLPK